MSLVTIVDKTPVTSASVIAIGMNISKASVAKLINNHIDVLNKVSSFQIQKVIKKTKGRPIEDWLLDEPQTSLLIMLMRNSESAVDFKYRLVKEFYMIRNHGGNGLRMLESAYSELEAYKDKGRAWSEFGRRLAQVKPIIYKTVQLAEQYAQVKIDFNK